MESQNYTNEQMAEAGFDPRILIPEPGVNPCTMGFRDSAWCLAEAQ